MKLMKAWGPWTAPRNMRGPGPVRVDTLPMAMVVAVTPGSVDGAPGGQLTTTPPARGVPARLAPRFPAGPLPPPPPVAPPAPPRPNRWVRPTPRPRPPAPPAHRQRSHRYQRHRYHWPGRWTGLSHS